MRNRSQRSGMPETRLLRGCSSILMTALILCAGAQAGSSAESLALHPGSLIRVHLKEPALGSVSQPNLLKGRLLDITATDISLETHAGKPPTVLPLDNVERLDLNIRQGRRGKGALIGAGAGVALISLYVLTRHDDDDISDVEGEWQLLSDEAGYALFGTMAASLGAIVGAIVAPGARWQPVLLEQVRLGTIDAPSAGPGFRLSVRF